MKAALLIAAAAIGLAGCATNQGGIQPSFEAETSGGRAMHFENDLATKDPRGAFENWRWGGDPDIIGPRMPVNPHKPQLEPPVIPADNTPP